MPEWKKTVLEFLGLKSDDVPTEEQLATGIDKAVLERQDFKIQLEDAQKEISTLKEQVTELEKLKPSAEVGDQYLKDTREKAESDYKLLRKAENEEPDDDMLELIRNADIGQAKVHAKNLAAEVGKKIPLKCPSCGELITGGRQSSSDGGDKGGDKPDYSQYQSNPI